MSAVEMKNSAYPQTHPPSDPPPYSASNAPHVMQPVAATVIHPGTTVIHGPGVMTVQQPGVSAIVVANQMSPTATMITCKSCHQQIVTRVLHKPSTRTHLFALLLCVVGCWPLVCLPYCMDSCNNAEHYCPNCNAYIGSYSS